MGESNFFSQEIKRAINREQKAISAVRDKKQKQEQSGIEESKTIEKKWSTKKAPHFTTAREEGYATRNAVLKGKGRLHPTWQGPR